MTENPLPEPRPSLSAGDAIRTQLDALEHNDHPHEDAGIGTAWGFASAANRAATGPLPAFERMVPNGTYRPMIDHWEAALGPVSVREATATAEVEVTGPEGRRRTYRFRLSSDHRASGTAAGSPTPWCPPNRRWPWRR